MNEMTLEYSQTRVQFGKPIGTYQVVQHRLADMFMSQEQGRSMAMLATMMVDEPDANERAHNIAMAKVGIGQAGRYVSQSAVQMHGGIGMTEELRRRPLLSSLHGDRAAVRRHRALPGDAGDGGGIAPARTLRTSSTQWERACPALDAESARSAGRGCCATLVKSAVPPPAACR